MLRVHVYTLCLTINSLHHFRDLFIDGRLSYAKGLILDVVGANVKNIFLDVVYV